MMVAILCLDLVMYSHVSHGQSKVHVLECLGLKMMCAGEILDESRFAKSIQVGLVGSTEVVEKTKGRMPGFLRVILSPGCITTEQLLCNAS